VVAVAATPVLCYPARARSWLAAAANSPKLAVPGFPYGPASVAHSIANPDLETARLQMGLLGNSGNSDFPFPDLHAEVRQMVDDGDCVAVRFELYGTNTGDYRYLPAPTGRRAVWEGIGIFRVVDGKIAEIWGTADRLGMLTQLDLLPDIG
jgi:predicted ester cyclase